MTIAIRTATEEDLDGLYRIAEDMEARHEKNYFERCLGEQHERKRIVLVATEGDRLVGYVQLVWTPTYATFRRLGIPEIQDLNVVPDLRGQGVGGRLVDTCEAFAREAGKAEIGISVGLNQSYGPAQRLYVKKGYIPDGAGLCCDDVPVRKGELRAMLMHHPIAFDQFLTIKMVKTLA